MINYAKTKTGDKLGDADHLALACQHYIATLAEFGPGHKYTGAAKLSIHHELGIFRAGHAPAMDAPAVSPDQRED